jgi:hypothetical protein
VHVFVAHHSKRQLDIRPHWRRVQQVFGSRIDLEIADRDLLRCGFAVCSSIERLFLRYSECSAQARLELGRLAHFSTSDRTSRRVDGFLITSLF